MGLSPQARRFAWKLGKIKKCIGSKHPRSKDGLVMTVAIDGRSEVFSTIPERASSLLYSTLLYRVALLCFNLNNIKTE
jgi:hypothetical protein